MQRHSWLPTLTIGLLIALALAGCRVQVTPTPTPTPPPPTPIPIGWTEHGNETFSIALPGRWVVLKVTGTNAADLFADFQARNPELARIIGSAAALEGAALWAFNNETLSTPFVDNLNVRISSLGGQSVTDLGPGLEAIAAQYRQLGFTVIGTTAGLTIGGRPAGRIAYTLPLTGSNGQPLAAEGIQYLIAGPNDLFILSYTLGPGRSASQAGIVEQSAQSFRVK